MKNKKAIAVLGGMGPQASVYMYKLLIDLSAEYFDAKNGEDYPEIIVYSIPAPDFILETDERSEVLNMLKEKVRIVNRLPVSNIGIACNTAHLLLDKLQIVSKARFISMIDETVQAIDLSIKKIGLLALPLTIESLIYQKSLEKKGIVTIIPTKSQITVLEKIIRDITKEAIIQKNRKDLLSIAKSLRAKGAQGIILGCTELPLIFPAKSTLPVYNPVEILAMALLSKYYKKP